MRRKERECQEKKYIKTRQKKEEEKEDYVSYIYLYLSVLNEWRCCWTGLLMMNNRWCVWIKIIWIKRYWWSFVGCWRKIICFQIISNTIRVIIRWIEWWCWWLFQTIVIRHIVHIRWCGCVIIYWLLKCFSIIRWWWWRKADRHWRSCLIVSMMLRMMIWTKR